jgi:beta-glucosidase-like glycosyl hydrolase
MKSTEISCKPLIFGIAGYSLTEAERDLFTKNPVIGFILFKRNIESKEQLIALTTNLKGLYTDKVPLIFVDQEGGRVARLKPPLCQLFQPAEFFGAIYDESGAKEAYVATKENSAEIMAILKAYGIDSPCGPVGDLRYENTDLVIGDRSFGKEVSKVVDLCSAFIEGIQEQDGIPVIKHMPGHGRATCDSHLTLPRITATLKELDNTDFAVFRELSKNPQVNWAMTAHIVFDALDEDKPVTLSDKSIKFIRESIGFKGILITDAIEMLALHGDIGVKYHSIKNLMNITLSSRPPQDSYIQTLEELGLIADDFSSQPEEAKLQYIQEQYRQSKLDFTQSLCDAALSSLIAGCDAILHCTGDIDEMTAICEAI